MGIKGISNIKNQILKIGLCLPVAILVLCATAQGRLGAQDLTGFAEPDEQPVTVSLVAEHTSIQPGSQTRVGVRFELEDGWHIYAEDPGDAGLPTAISWLPNPWVAFMPLEWPEPKEFVNPGDLHTFGYEEEVLLTSMLTLAPDAPIAEMLPIEANIKWLACSNVCIPGSAELQLTLSVSLAEPRHSIAAALFESKE